MPILRIEHSVPDFDAWKEAFDSDSVGREKSGVHRYQILRAIDEPNHVMIDLEFDTVSEAEVPPKGQTAMMRAVDLRTLSRRAT